MNENQSLKEDKMRKEKEGDDTASSGNKVAKESLLVPVNPQTSSTSLMSALKLSAENFRPNMLVSTAGYPSINRSCNCSVGGSSSGSSSGENNSTEHTSASKSKTFLTPHVEDSWDEVVLQLCDLSRDSSKNKNKNKENNLQKGEEVGLGPTALQTATREEMCTLKVESSSIYLGLQITGPCARCSMINVDGSSGSFDCRAFEALAGYRRHKKDRQVYFGQFLGGGVLKSAIMTTRTTTLLSKRSNAPRLCNHNRARGACDGTEGNDNNTDNYNYQQHSHYAIHTPLQIRRAKYVVLCV